MSKSDHEILGVLDVALSRNVSFVEKEQQADGSFLSFSGVRDTQGNIIDPQLRKTTFITSSILCALAPLLDNEQNRHKVTKIAEHAIDFLLSQKSQNWTWNYWTRENASEEQDQASKQNQDEYYHGNIPDDLDDTFVALSAINVYKPQLIDAKVLADVVKNLTITETETGGPYNTWLLPEKSQKWQDIDVVVNSNIAYFLNSIDVHLDSINQLAETVIKNVSYQTKYYTSFHSVLYAISRSTQILSKPYKNQAIQHILNNQTSEGTFGNPLETALCISTLIHFGFKDLDKINNAINQLLEWSTGESSTNKAAPVFGYYIEESKKLPAYAGCHVLTAALICEALSKYKNMIQTSDVEPNFCEKVNQQEINELQSMVVEKVRKCFSGLPKNIKAPIHKTLNTLLDGDRFSQITLLPYFTIKSTDDVWTRNEVNSLNTDIILDLGVANTLGWLAYTLYDDVLDGDKSLPVVSVANIAMRNCIKVYNKVTDSYRNDPILSDRTRAFQEIFDDVLNKIDIANKNEFEMCHIGQEAILNTENLADYNDLSILADKSFGHALGPIFIFLAQGEKPDSSDMKNLHRFFRHYIIARQLNDDAHDWLEDFNNGSLNSVSTEIVKDYLLRMKEMLNGTDDKINTNSTIELDLLPDHAESERELEKVFWNKTIDSISEKITVHIKEAKEALSRIKIIKDKSYFEKILEPLQKSANEAIRERDSTKRFLEAY